MSGSGMIDFRARKRARKCLRWLAACTSSRALRTGCAVAADLRQGRSAAKSTSASGSASRRSRQRSTSCSQIRGRGTCRPTQRVWPESAPDPPHASGVRCTGIAAGALRIPSADGLRSLPRAAARADPGRRAARLFSVSSSEPRSCSACISFLRWVLLSNPFSIAAAGRSPAGMIADRTLPSAPPVTSQDLLARPSTGGFSFQTDVLRARSRPMFSGMRRGSGPPARKPR